MNNRIVIVNENNQFFSAVKVDTPKMINSMKALCEKYKDMFGTVFKVKRLIATKSGYKLA